MPQPADQMQLSLRSKTAFKRNVALPTSKSLRVRAVDLLAAGVGARNRQTCLK